MWGEAKRGHGSDAPFICFLFSAFMQDSFGQIVVLTACVGIYSGQASLSLTKPKESSKGALYFASICVLLF